MARVRRHRKRHPCRSLLMIPAGAMIPIALLMVIHDFHQGGAPIADWPNVTAIYDDPDLFPGPIGVSRQNRVIYPYSVIPGGAHTLTELQAAEANNPVVRKHYAGFDHARFRITRLSEEKKFYVSYRLGDEVFWTKKKLRVPAGEELMTDGVGYARTRCGNRLSEVPHAKTSPRQPLVALLETPVSAGPFTPVGLFTEGPPEELLPPVPVYLFPAPGSRETPIPPAASGPSLPLFPVFPGSVGPSPPTTPQQSRSPVPEPGTWWLLSSTLGGFLLYRKRFNKECPRGK